MKSNFSILVLAAVSVSLALTACGKRDGSVVSTANQASSLSAASVEAIPKTITTANVLKVVDDLDLKMKRKVVILDKDNGFDILQKFRSALNSQGSDGKTIDLLDSAEAYCQLHQMKNCKPAMKRAAMIKVLTDKLAKSCGLKCSKQSKAVAFSLVARGLEFRNALGVTKPVAKATAPKTTASKKGKVVKKIKPLIKKISFGDDDQREIIDREIIDADLEDLVDDAADEGSDQHDGGELPETVTI